MSLVTPDFGLLFWMVLIFGVVFFILAKFGFPIITGMVEKRGEHIEESLKAADEAQRKLASLEKEQAAMIEQAKLEQGRILKEAAAARDQMVEQAKAEAREEAQKIFEHARLEIAAERESAIRDIRSRVALISVEVAEKVVKKELGDNQAQLDLVDRYVDEVSNQQMS